MHETQEQQEWGEQEEVERVGWVSSFGVLLATVSTLSYTENLGGVMNIYRNFECLQEE